MSARARSCTSPVRARATCTLGCARCDTCESAPARWRGLSERFVLVVRRATRSTADRRARARRRVSRHRQPFGREELSPLARRPRNSDTPLEAGIGFTVLPKLKGFRTRRSSLAARCVCVCVCVCRARFDFSVEGHSLRSQALEAQRASGVRRKLVCLVLDDASAPPLHGAETIWRDGVCVGIVAFDGVRAIHRPRSPMGTFRANRTRASPRSPTSGSARARTRSATKANGSQRRFTSKRLRPREQAASREHGA